MLENSSHAAIMVVDDTPANLTLLSNVLRERGHSVFSFPRGELALQAAMKNPPDLILLDVRMPGINGYEVCERLKADARLRDIPVIFISASNETIDKVRAFGVGGVDYVTKPFQFEEVHARVGTHLRIRRLQQELQEKYDELRKLEEMKDNLVHMIVHDLRSPLQAVVGFAELLERYRPNLDARGQQCLDEVGNGAQRLMEMVSDVLDVTRLEAGRMPLQMIRTDLRKVVQDTATELLGLTKEHSLVLKSPEDPVDVECDAEIVRRVLTNLVGNAAKFSPQGTEIQVRVTFEGPAARVEVQDHGPGIPQEHHARIFEKFWQVGELSAGVKYSTGLGLTFCKLAVEEHGGAIGVDSTVGEGSTFWFTIPRACSPGERAPGA